MENKELVVRGLYDPETNQTHYLRLDEADAKRLDTGTKKICLT